VVVKFTVLLEETYECFSLQEYCYKHSKTCPQVVDGWTASNMEGSCEYIE